ncbi:MAG TPA: FHA domain-containing protein [Polyangiaceae bacterium]|jgi:ABC-type multidrug transport system ATPase subunit/pSer/pThr/pTyr-binding forkhead associated (FHA) protein|nr:FHA domain-containing protein [Polyangiaceae bacterium]
MIPGFAKQTIVIGSSPSADIRLGGAGVAPEHARLVHEGNGRLMFVDGGTGVSTAGGQQLAPASRVAFDFRTPFTVGSSPVPLAHRAITLMLLELGQVPVTPGKLLVGRDPTRSNLVVHHPNVSGLHATLTLAPPAIADHGSTSGTWLGQRKLEPNHPQPIDPGGVIALGPIPMEGSLALELLRSLAGGGAAEAAVPAPFQTGAAAMMPVEPAKAQMPRKKHQTVLGQVSLGGSGETTKSIGRTKENDIALDNPQVSSRHALLHKVGNDLFLEDRGSANGTFVRGQKIPAGQRTRVSNGEKVFIGPMPLILQFDANDLAVVVEDSDQWAGKPLFEIEAWDLVMEVPDRDNPGTQKTLLDHVSFKALPGDFIALMGPSGAGKTTLLLTLNGYLPPSAGQVRVNGEDLYAIYDNLRGSIGYVPQDDIVHPELTVWEAVRYSARFRLPPDYSEDEIDRRVSTTLSQLGLEGVAHLQIGKPEKKVLSGGQRKRVNIAMELVTDPVIMFLDEPTSGLAADDTTALVDLLHTLAKATGKTIIATIHQPAKDEFEKFNLALILGPGGITMFFGPTKPDAYRFFGSYLERIGKTNVVDNPRDMFDMLNQREKPIWERVRAENPSSPRSVSRQAAAREWNAEFFNDANPTFQQMYAGKRAVGEGTSSQGVTRTPPKTTGQFGLLFSRYMRIKSRDVSGTAIMLAQAPIIGILLSLVFGGQKDAVPFWCLGALQELATRSGQAETGNDTLKNMIATPDHTGPIFFLVVSAVWFGTSNAAREIVSERAIYVRERMVNLKLWNYVVSKFVLLSLFCVVQCTILLTIVFFALGFRGGFGAFLVSLGTLIATAMNSVALGLFVSALVTSSEASMALTPIALIPQVVLGGLMVPMTTNPMLKWPMFIIPARWGFQGVVGQERLAVANDPPWIIDLKKPDLTSVPDFLVAGKFRCAEAQIASDTFVGAWGFVNYDMAWLPPAVLTAMMVVLLATILVILKARDAV